MKQASASGTWSIWLQVSLNASGKFCMVEHEHCRLPWLPSYTCIYLLQQWRHLCLEALCGGSTAPWLLGHAALGAITWQHLFRMSDEVFPNSTGIVLALGSGIATTLIYVQRLNKALHSSLEMIRFPSAPRFYQICN